MCVIFRKNCIDLCVMQIDFAGPGKIALKWFCQKQLEIREPPTNTQSKNS